MVHVAEELSIRKWIGLLVCVCTVIESRTVLLYCTLEWMLLIACYLCVCIATSSVAYVSEYLSDYLCLGV